MRLIRCFSFGKVSNSRVQKTTENSENDNVSGENTGNTDPIGPGV